MPSNTEDELPVRGERWDRTSLTGRIETVTVKSVQGRNRHQFVLYRRSDGVSGGERLDRFLASYFRVGKD